MLLGTLWSAITILIFHQCCIALEIDYGCTGADWLCRIGVELCIAS
jgi:hypothetical protein